MPGPLRAISSNPLGRVSLRGSAPVAAVLDHSPRPFILSFMDERHRSVRPHGGLGDDHRCSAAYEYSDPVVVTAVWPCGHPGANGSVRSILDHNLDCQAPSRPRTDALPLVHTNIRGPLINH